MLKSSRGETFIISVLLKEVTVNAVKIIIILYKGLYRVSFYNVRRSGKNHC